MVRDIAFVSRNDALRAVIVVTVAAAALAATLSTLSVFWIPRAEIGIGLSGTTIAGVAPHSIAQRAGIKAGDRLDPTYGFAERARFLWYDDFAPGEQVALRTVHDGHVRTTIIRAVAHGPPISATTATLMALRLLTYVIFIVVGASLVLLKPARFSWGFFLCCLGLATLPALVGRAASSLDASFGLVTYGVWLIIADLANVGFLAFALRFPSDDARGWRLTVWRTLPLWFLVFVGIDAWAVVAWYSGTHVPDWVATASWAIGIAAWAVSTLSLVLTYRRADGRNRKRLLWAIVGASVGYLAWYLDGVLHALGSSIAGDIVGFGTLALPISIGYAVLRHRVIDVRFAINRALVVSFVGTCVVGVLALTYWATTELLQESHLAFFAQAALAVLVGVSLHRLYLVIKDASTRVMAGDLRRAQALIARAAGAVSSAESYEALESLLAREVAGALELDFAVIFRRGQDGSFERTVSCGEAGAAPATLESNDALVLLASTDRNPIRSHVVREQGAAVALPVFESDVLRALALFGPHRNGFDIDPDELQAIAAMALPAGDAYRHLDRSTQQVHSLALAVRDWDRGQFLGYLADQILESLPPDERKVLLAIASVPDPDDREVALAAGMIGAGGRAAALARSLPFIDINADGTYSMQPALRQSLRDRIPDHGESAIVACAADATLRCDYSRSAALFMEAGRRTQALGALEELYRMQVGDLSLIPAPEHLRIIDAASAAELALQPVVLTLLMQLRSPLRDEPALHAHAAKTLQRLEHGTARSILSAWLAYSLSESGDREGAARVLSAHRGPEHDDMGVRRVHIDGVAGGMLLAKEGRLDQAAFVLDAARPFGSLLRAIHVESARGNRAEARTLVHAAVDRMPKPWPPVFVAALADQLIGEWLAGSQADFDEIASILATCEDERSAFAFDHLVKNANGGSEDAPERAHPRHAAYSLLMRASNAADQESAVRLAHRALESAMAAGEALVEINVLVCLAGLEPECRHERLSRAADLAVDFESAALHSGLAAVIGDGDDIGMFDRLVGRISARRTGQSERLKIHLVSGLVQRGSTPLSLAESELALLFALASTPGPQSALALVDMLWPDHDEQSAIRSLQSCVYRLRTRLNDPTAVESTAQGYRLRPDMSVDLVQAEQFLAVLNGTRALDHYAIIRLGSLRRAFGGVRAMPMAMWEWFGAVEQRIVGVTRAVRLRLAQHWLRVGRYESVLECARDMIAADDLDEAGWEMSIRAHLGLGSIGEGQRDYRVYRELLARELAVEPPPSLTALLSANADRQIS
jgi:DNA-binding SARP family transcriptional activator